MKYVANHPSSGWPYQIALVVAVVVMSFVLGNGLLMLFAPRRWLRSKWAFNKGLSRDHAESLLGRLNLRGIGLITTIATAYALWRLMRVLL